MTGEWLTVKWAVSAICVACLLLNFVVIGLLSGKARNRGFGLLGLTVVVIGLPNLVRDLSTSLIALRASFLVAGTGAVGMIVTLLCFWFRTEREALLRADG